MILILGTFTFGGQVFSFVLLVSKEYCKLYYFKAHRACINNTSIFGETIVCVLNAGRTMTHIKVLVVTSYSWHGPSSGLQEWRDLQGDLDFS